MEGTQVHDDKVDFPASVTCFHLSLFAVRNCVMMGKENTNSKFTPNTH